MQARQLKKAIHYLIHSNPIEKIRITLVEFAKIFHCFIGFCYARFCTYIRAFLVRFCRYFSRAFARIFFTTIFSRANYLAKSCVDSSVKYCTKILLAPLALCLMCASSPLSASTLDWEDLEDTQKALLKKLWAVGKPFDFHYALIAISYTESRLGLYPLNLQTYDCGVLHINIKSYLKFNKIKDSPLNRNIYCGNLIINEDLSINAALDTLQYFYNYWSKRKKNPLEYAIKSYNAGFKVNSRSAQKYYNKIYKNIKAVQKLEKQGLLRQQRANKVQ